MRLGTAGTLISVALALRMVEVLLSDLALLDVRLGDD